MGKFKLFLAYCRKHGHEVYINFPFFVENFHAREYFCPFCGDSPIQKRHRKAPKDVKVSCYQCVMCENKINFYFLTFDRNALSNDYYLYCPLCGLRKLIKRKLGDSKDEKNS